MSRLALGIDIGGTKIAAALVTDDGTVRGRRQVATPQSGPAILDAVRAVGTEIIGESRAQGQTVVAAGVGTAGHVDCAHGVITYASNTLPGWMGLALGPELEDTFSLPVAVDNDVNAMAAGEMHFGAGRIYREALYVAVGTGVGGALARDGRLWTGATWTAGELGHLVVDWDGTRRCSCGRPGHLSAYTSGIAIAARYAERAGVSHVDLQKVAALARSGDGLANETIQEGARILGLALGGLLDVLDPQALIVGGGLLELGDLWWAPLEASLRDNPMPGPTRIDLRRAELGQDAAIVGAAWNAFNRLTTNY